MAQTETLRSRKDFQLGLLFLLANLLVSVAAQFLLKRGMLELGGFELSEGWLYMLEMINPLIVGGLLLYASGTVLWLLCLRKLELSFAYPAGTLQYLLIFMGAWLWFDEQISLLRVAGMVVICVGVFFLAIDLKKS